jgi:hypothetical protein
VETKTATVAHLGIGEALRLLCEPKARQWATAPAWLVPGFEFSTNFKDGSLVLVTPSEHDGFYYVERINTHTWMAEGCRRPVRADAVAVFLEVLGVPRDTVWLKHTKTETANGPQWMRPRDDDSDLAAAKNLGLVQ